MREHSACIQPYGYHGFKIAGQGAFRAALAASYGKLSACGQPIQFYSRIIHLGSSASRTVP